MSFSVQQALTNCLSSSRDCAKTGIYRDRDVTLTTLKEFLI